MPDDDAMDVDAVREGLSTAIAQQTGSLLTLTLLAGAVRGASGAALKDRLRGYAVAEITDLQRLVEKLIVLGGQVPAYDAPPPPGDDATAALRDWLDREAELMTSLHAVIEPSGQEPESEALEHLIEHILLRKQEQVDFLRLALD
jgi:hypothetical protein